MSVLCAVSPPPPRHHFFTHNAVFLWVHSQAGPKTLKTAMKLEAQVVANMLMRGPKMFYNSLKQFVPTLVDSTAQGLP